jgi:hypothetical protein
MQALIAGLLFLCFSIVGPQASAKPQEINGRVFGGGVNVSPDEVNTELKDDGLKKISTTLLLGIEGSYPVLSWLELGVRYAKNQVNRDEDPSDPDHGYKVYASQDMLMLMARFPIVKSNFFIFDIFGGYGGVSTVLKIEDASQSGELSRNSPSDVFRTGVHTYGASMSVGWKSFFLFVEGGVLGDKVDAFKRTGTIRGEIQKLDLSGTYGMVGFLFNGGLANAGGSSKK